MPGDEVVADDDDVVADAVVRGKPPVVNEEPESSSRQDASDDCERTSQASPWSGTPTLWGTSHTIVLHGRRRGQAVAISAIRPKNLSA
jgi:hypothetical protein